MTDWRCYFGFEGSTLGSTLKQRRVAWLSLVSLIRIKGWVFCELYTVYLLHIAESVLQWQLKLLEVTDRLAAGGRSTDCDCRQRDCFQHVRLCTWPLQRFVSTIPLLYYETMEGFESKPWILTVVDAVVKFWPSVYKLNWYKLDLLLKSGTVM